MQVIVTMVKSRLAKPDCSERGWLLDGCVNQVMRACLRLPRSARLPAAWTALATDAVCSLSLAQYCRFPRAGSQAEALEAANIRPDVFVLLNVPDDAIVERVVGRRLDPDTGKIYHLKFAPPPPEVRALLLGRMPGLVTDAERCLGCLDGGFVRCPDALRRYMAPVRRFAGCQQAHPAQRRHRGQV